MGAVSPCLDLKILYFYLKENKFFYRIRLYLDLITLIWYTFARYGESL